MPAGWFASAGAPQVDFGAGNPAGPGFGYGYQWWRYDRRGTEVWAGNGFGGQFLIVIPAHNIVAVVNSWNVFGAQTPGIMAPAIDAVLNAARVPQVTGSNSTVDSANAARDAYRRGSAALRAGDLTVARAEMQRAARVEARAGAAGERLGDDIQLLLGGFGTAVSGDVPIRLFR